MASPLILADDISGAAESAAALGVEHSPELLLWPDLPSSSDARSVVIDVDSRDLPADAATQRIRTVLDAAPAAAPIVKKIDSLLRGNIAAEIAPLVAADAVVLLTSALPALSRTVVDGRPLIDGVPLASTTHWALESAEPPKAVVDVLGGVETSSLDLAAIRAGGLSARLAAHRGQVVVCDAETDADLDALVQAGLAADIAVHFAGSSALVRALGRTLGTGVAPTTEASELRASGVLYVLGTGAAELAPQIDVLREHARTMHRVISGERLAALTEAEAASIAGDLAAALDEGASVLLQLDHDPRVAIDGAAIVAGLAAIVVALAAATAGPPTPLLATGGQTARAVLGALGVSRLSVEQEIHPGAVVLRAPDGRRIATRPGSHGGRDSLWRIHQALTQTDSKQESS